ncbi:MAG: hypothetical protein ACRCS9_16005 [Hyphomicrobium sp.]
METLLPLIIQLVSGALGGNVAGGLLKNLSLGTLGNSLAGLVGGGLGGQILGPLIAGGAPVIAASGGLDIPAILAQVASGGVGGGVMLAVVGILKSLLGK